MTAYTEADVERVARALCRYAGQDGDAPQWVFYRGRALAVLGELSVHPVGWTEDDDRAPEPVEDPPAPKDLTEAWRLGCGLV
jgi:hypothetical protein